MDTNEWRMGPLMVGLWTTLRVSAVAGVMVLFLGLITGLCRISKNPTLWGPAAMYLVVTASLSQLVFYMERRFAMSD